MSRFYKYATAILLIMLATMLFASVMAQDESPTPQETPPVGVAIPYPPDQIPAEPPVGQATITVSATSGGITDPTTGTRNYDNGTVITLSATPYVGFSFHNWLVTGFYVADVVSPPVILEVDADGNPIIPALNDTSFTTANPVSVSLVLSQNPLVVLCGYGYAFTYQAVFVPNPGSTGSPDIATLVVKSSVGGKVTPGEGTYTFAQGSSKTLTATPDTGFEFQYWVVSGFYFPGHGLSSQALDSPVVTTNPLVVSCGVGYSYTYQPIFAPTGTSTTSGGTPVTYFYVIIAVLAIIAVVAVAFAVMKRGNK